jgi:putative FmdB family regulatory protein
MPTYVYQAREPEGGCGSCRPGFETVQRMSDDPLEKCPSCGAAVHRIPQAPFINTTVVGGQVSDSKLKSLGFTKLTRDGDGNFRKQFGNDPAAKDLPSH